jgi:hypothetical protein
MAKKRLLDWVWLGEVEETVDLIDFAGKPSETV